MVSFDAAGLYWRVVVGCEGRRLKLTEMLLDGLLLVLLAAKSETVVGRTLLLNSDHIGD